MRTIKAGQKKAPPERAGAALGAVLPGPHKTPLVPSAIHAAPSEPAASAAGQRGRLYRWRPLSSSQRHRPSYTVSPAGQRLKRSGSHARYRSALAMVIDARASALVTPWSGPSTLAAPAVASSRVSRSGCRRAVVL